MIGLIDYNMGNLLSVRRALAAAGGEAKLITGPEEFEGMDGILLPGVGNFVAGAEQLEHTGLDAALRAWCAADRPFLGICLGMQLLFDESEEAPDAKGLGIIPGRVPRFPEGGEKVPHMGWNQVRWTRQDVLNAGIADDEFYYFVHSYYVEPADPSWLLGGSEYMVPFAAVVGQGRVFATQFHPEKSQSVGRRLLENFIALTERA